MHLESSISLPEDLSELVDHQNTPSDLFDVALDMEVYKRLYQEAQRLYFEHRGSEKYSLKEEWPFKESFTIEPEDDMPVFTLKITNLIETDLESITVYAYN